MRWIAHRGDFVIGGLQLAVQVLHCKCTSVNCASRWSSSKVLWPCPHKSRTPLVPTTRQPVNSCEPQSPHSYYHMCHRSQCVCVDHLTKFYTSPIHRPFGLFKLNFNACAYLLSYNKSGYWINNFDLSILIWFRWIKVADITFWCTVGLLARL